MPLRLNSQLRAIRPAARWLNGGPVDIAELRGRPVLIHFWALSSQASREQLPRVIRWQEHFGESVGIIGIHTPLEVSDMDHDRVEAAVRELGLRHPMALDADDGALADAYDLRHVPSYFVFDASERLRHYHSGPRALAPVERVIERLTGSDFIRNGHAAHTHG